MHGRTLTGFELLEPIGHGGGGVVWRARHRSGVDAAVKVLVSERARTPRAIELFEREIRTIAGLRHPGIVEVYDTGIVPPGLDGLEPGSPWLAMGWVEHTLTSWLRGDAARRRWGEVRRVLLELLEALAHAHAHGVVHLDVKPQNVLLDGEGRVRLADFGIASTPDDDTQDGSSGAGTPLFMAPERFLMGRPPVPATDLYSVGCLAYWLACGRPPFHLPSQALARAHLLETPPALQLPSRWPPRFTDWVDVLLAKSPERRFEFAADAARALSALPERSTASAPSFAPLPVATESDTWQTETPFEAPPPVVEPRQDLPPVPRDWPATPPTPHQLGGAGLGLFGVRAPPLVGRSAERAAAWRALVEVGETRSPRLLWLGGPAGVGRTRLADELARAAHACGAAEVLQASHGPSGGAAHGFPAMFERWLPTRALMAAERDDQIRRRLPDAPAEDVQRLGAWISGEALRPEEQDRLVLLVLKVATHRRVVVWWLDDLDQEPGVAPLVARVLRSDLPVLVVVTAGEGVGGELRALRDTPGAVRVDLSPLGAEGIRDLLGGSLGLDPELVGGVVERSGGVPLFAVHLVGDWIRRGVLVAHDGGLRLASGATADLPDDLHRLWLDRLADLPRGLAEALEVAAVLGGLVSVEEWRAACRRAGISPAGLDDAARRGLVRVAEETFELGHALLRESLVRRSEEAGRTTAVHRACAEVLEEATHPGTKLRRARHLLEAGAPEALAAAEEAARELRRLGDFRAAERALSVAERAAGPGDLGRVLDLRARVELELGAFDVCVRTCSRLLVAAGDDPALRGTALRLRGNAHQMWGDPLSSRDDLESALPLLRAAGDAEQEGDCHHGLALTALHVGRPDLAAEHLDRAEVLYRAANGPDVWWAWLDWARADALVTLGRLEDAGDAARRAERRFGAAGLAWQELLVRGLHAEIAMEAGQRDLARTLLDVQRADADALGLGGAPRTLIDATWAHNEVLAGRYADAEPRLREGVAELEVARWGRRLLGLWAGLALCALARGDDEEAERCLTKVEGLVEQHPWPDRANVQLLEHGATTLAASDPARATRFAIWLDRLAEPTLT